MERYFKAATGIPWHVRFINLYPDALGGGRLNTFVFPGQFQKNKSIFTKITSLINLELNVFDLFPSNYKATEEIILSVMKAADINQSMSLEGLSWPRSPVCCVLSLPAQSTMHTIAQGQVTYNLTCIMLQICWLFWYIILLMSEASENVMAIAEAQESNHCLILSAWYPSCFFFFNCTSAGRYFF